MEFNNAFRRAVHWEVILCRFSLPPERFAANGARPQVDGGSCNADRVTWSSLWQLGSGTRYGRWPARFPGSAKRRPPFLGTTDDKCEVGQKWTKRDGGNLGFLAHAGS